MIHIFLMQWKTENTIFQKAAMQMDIRRWHLFRTDPLYMMQMGTKNGNFIPIQLVKQECIVSMRGLFTLCLVNEGATT